MQCDLFHGVLAVRRDRSGGWRPRGRAGASSRGCRAGPRRSPRGLSAGAKPDEPRVLHEERLVARQRAGLAGDAASLRAERLRGAAASRRSRPSSSRPRARSRRAARARAAGTAMWLAVDRARSGAAPAARRRIGERRGEQRAAERPTAATFREARPRSSRTSRSWSVGIATAPKLPGSSAPGRAPLRRRTEAERSRRAVELCRARGSGYASLPRIALFECATPYARRLAARVALVVGEVATPSPSACRRGSRPCRRGRRRPRRARSR